MSVGSRFAVMGLDRGEAGDGLLGERRSLLIGAVGERRTWDVECYEKRVK